MAALYDLSILVRASFMVTSLSVANLIRDDSSRYEWQSLESELRSGLEQLIFVSRLSSGRGIPHISCICCRCWCSGF